MTRPRTASTPASPRAGAPSGGRARGRAEGRSGAGARNAVIRRYLPPQHGAWAMLLLPYVVGVAIAGPAVGHVPLLVAWLAGYLLSYYAFLVVKTGRVGRAGPPLRLYGGVCAAAAIVVVALAPQVLWFAPVFGALVLVNTWFARRKDDRALLNDLASVVQSGLIVPVALVVAGQDAAVAAVVAAPAAAVVTAYFTGSVLYVKTMIRNRGERAYLAGSIGFHAVAAAVLVPVAWPLAVFFGWLTVRAAVLPGRPLTPKQVGILEAVHSAALAVAAPLLLG